MAAALVFVLRHGCAREDRGVDLLTTLETYYATGCSIRRRAAQLGVHRNTVLHRLKRVEELTLPNLDDQVEVCQPRFSDFAALVPSLSAGRRRRRCGRARGSPSRALTRC
jgi:hypothetical protein